MSLWWDSILNPVCVFIRNMGRCLFWPLVVTASSLYLYAVVFITCRFSSASSSVTWPGAVGAAPALVACLAPSLVCLFWATAVPASKAGSNKLKSLREYFITGSLLLGFGGTSLNIHPWGADV